MDKDKLEGSPWPGLIVGLLLGAAIMLMLTLGAQKRVEEAIRGADAKRWAAPEPEDFKFKARQVEGCRLSMPIVWNEARAELIIYSEEPCKNE